MPLAIELAAARVRVLGLAGLVERLDKRFRWFSTDNRAVPLRQQALGAMIDWSYDLLSEQERALFRQLSIFAGGWTATAAETICGADAGFHSYDVLELLTRLVDRSLVQVVPGADGRVRYRLLETLRQYALERLEGGGEAEAYRDRHVDFLLQLAEQAEPELTGPEQASWLARLDAEHDNLRAALRWAAATGRAGAGLRLAGALWRFWRVRGYVSEGQRWLDVMLVHDLPELRQNGQRPSMQPEPRALSVALLLSTMNAPGRYTKRASYCGVSCETSAV